MTTVEQLLERFEAATDPAELAGLCRADPSLVVFDRDGYNYRSRAHWALRPALPRRADRDNRDIRIEGDCGWVTYAGTEDERITLVLVRSDPDGWRIAHVHASPATPGPRPGGI